MVHDHPGGDAGDDGQRKGREMPPGWTTPRNRKKSSLLTPGIRWKALPVGADTTFRVRLKFARAEYQFRLTLLLPLSAPPAARTSRRVAGAAERLAAGRAGRLAGGFGQVQLVVADEAHAIEAEARLAQRRLGRGWTSGVPVEPDQPLALAAADQHLEALHRHDRVPAPGPIRP